jgi:hypothetical protein
MQAFDKGRTNASALETLTLTGISNSDKFVGWVIKPRLSPH